MLRTILVALAMAAVTAHAAEAAECAIVPEDITHEIQTLIPEGQVATARSLDPDSAEPIRRYGLVLSDGSVLTVEQRHCSMYNVTVRLISTAPHPSGEQLELMAQAFALTPTAQQWFADEAKQALLDEFRSDRFREMLAQPGGQSYGIDDRLSSTEEYSQAVVSVSRLNLPGWEDGSFVSLYVGVGGL